MTILGGINNSPQSRYDEWDYAVSGQKQTTNTNDTYRILPIGPIQPFFPKNHPAPQIQFDAFQLFVYIPKYLQCSCASDCTSGDSVTCDCPEPAYACAPGFTQYVVFW